MSALLLASAVGEGCIAVVGLIVAVISAVIFGTFGSPERERNLGAVGERFGGVYVPGFAEGDRVEFRVDGTPAHLNHFAGARGFPPFTRIRFDLAPAGCLRVFPEGIFASLRKAFGVQDIEVRDARFDGAFVIKGSPERWVCEVLDPETRQRINALASLGESVIGGAAIVIEAGPPGITVTCGKDLTGESRTLHAFVDHSLALFRRIATPGPNPVRIISASVGTPPGACPICANPLDAGARSCPACATPHHADCWNYFGGCAIYACTNRGGRN